MNLPALLNEFNSFEISVRHNIEETKKPFSIGDQIRSAKDTTIQVWEYAKHASVDYCKALNMRLSDIASLEDLDRYVSVILSNGVEIMLVPKNTCGCPYGGSWEHLLQPRISNGELPNTGGGTTYIAILPPEVNQEIIKAIQTGNVEVRKGNIWP